MTVLYGFEIDGCPHFFMNRFGNGQNPSNDPAWTNNNWLKSRFHFSFAEYHNPKNSSYGVLRVMNDDLVQPKRGFGTHPHRNMEIITYIVHGKLTHKDSMGSAECLGRGSIQFMTAGKGVSHSEYNDTEKPLRFIQTCVLYSIKTYCHLVESVCSVLQSKFSDSLL